jgi:hypothetical protein
MGERTIRLSAWLLSLSCFLSGAPRGAAQAQGFTAGGAKKKATALPASKLPRLGVSENQRFLVTADGRPFFWLGDTAWALIQKSRREDSDKQPGVARYFENRAAKGFNVLQTRLVRGEKDANAYGHPPFVNNDFSRPRVVDGPDNDYWDYADYVVDLAARHGVYLALLPIWGNSIAKEHAMLKDTSIAYRYGHFLGARYRDRPHIVWVLGGDTLRDGLKEADPLWPPMIRAMAEGIADGVNGTDKFDGRADYSTTLMTYHPRGSGHSSAIYLHDEAWLDFNMIQTTSRFNFTNYEYVTRDYNRQPPKPVLDSEVAYEYSISLRSEERAQVGERRLSPWEVRKAAYWAVFAGACGHTYGHRSFIGWALEGERLGNGADVAWHKSLDAPGAFQMNHLKRLMESRPFLSRVPDESLIAAAQEKNMDYAQATRGDGYALVYAPSGRAVTVNLSKLGGKVVAWWFDPREGKARRVGVFPASRAQVFRPPTGGAGQDWVLVLDDARRRFAPPAQ